LRRYDVQDSDANDLIQEVLLTVSRELGTFEHRGQPGAFRGWLKAILINRLRKFWRARGRRPQARGDSDIDARIAQLDDTLRICIAESVEQRPTAIDSQPNSVNDVVLILKCVKPSDTSSEDTDDQLHAGRLSPQLARSLIPKGGVDQQRRLPEVADKPRSPIH
jgi:DNA-directed RNA polymerase specialized sigma24 family protein